MVILCGNHALEAIQSSERFFPIFPIHQFFYPWVISGSVPLIGVIKEQSKIITKKDIRLVVTLENILKVEELNK